MSKRDKSEFTRIKNDRMKGIGRCELCGSKRTLELHHCIPVCLGGDDSEENLILVCGKCHSQLTPRSLLTKLGLKKAITESRGFVYATDFYKELAEIGEAMKESDDYYSLDLQEILDVFDKLIIQPKGD